MNKPKSNNLPKSLHTITAIVRVARHLMDSRYYPTPDDAVVKAVDVLGYATAADPDGLVAKALAQLAPAA